MCVHHLYTFVSLKFWSASNHHFILLFSCQWWDVKYNGHVKPPYNGNMRHLLSSHHNENIRWFNQENFKSNIWSAITLLFVVNWLQPCQTYFLRITLLLLPLHMNWLQPCQAMHYHRWHIQLTIPYVIMQLC